MSGNAIRNLADIRINKPDQLKTLPSSVGFFCVQIQPEYIKPRDKQQQQTLATHAVKNKNIKRQKTTCNLSNK
jgi:hypothetical protein